jgi:UDP-N-acetylglucosamine 2-epimerase (non-hydrolysing)
MNNIFQVINPDLVLVHGDTITSTFSAFSAFFNKVKVAHVEAGLRTHNINSPWPEEMNRQITGRLASFHFVPTIRAKRNLLNENIPESRIIQTGNTVIDALFIILKRLNTNTDLLDKAHNKIDSFGYGKERLKKNNKIVLITGHRRENFGKGFENICHAIKALSNDFPEVDFIYPVHLNPNVQNPVRSILSTSANPNIFLIEPMDYLPFIYLMSKSYLILTDSGGIQEEAPSLGKPVLVMRENTERPEAIESGTARLVGTNTQSIIQNVSELLHNPIAYRQMASKDNPYGDGRASERIIEFLKNSL